MTRSSDANVIGIPERPTPEETPLPLLELQARAAYQKLPVELRRAHCLSILAIAEALEQAKPPA